MKKLFLLSLTITLFCTAFSQKKVDDKHENHFKKPATVETDNFSIDFEDMHCQMAFISTKAIIKNKTTDILIIDLSAVKFKTEKGEYTNAKSKELLIFPFEEKSTTLKVDGGTDFHVESFSLSIENVKKVKVKGEVMQGEDFALPPRNNSIEIGPFTCTNEKLTKKTDNMEAKFEVRYSGAKIGIVDQSKMAVKFPNGNEYANVKKTSKLKSLISGSDFLLLYPGDKAGFTVQSDEHKPDGDMQFIELLVVWNDAFVESEAEDIDGVSANFELDFAKTEGKN